ncbi:RING/FYVE/PHD zinc finger superfamily protein [Abeliophyllum distichum]|uniref:RING/FYVE/PHD zinc finger superfamily protein n=1 Tax=Abeliophyllum distichum TaxID=126358 RepID=A0ABD1QIL8_9LAMI
MESTVEIESGVGLEGVGEKRPAQEDVEVLKEAKRIRRVGGLVVNVKKVAEMVLVLAAMGKMRGGREPDGGREGLDGGGPGKVGQGFRPPKLSIAEKLLLSKRKMKKSEDFSLPSTPHSSQRQQVNSRAGVESCGTPNGVRMSQLDKPSHMSISSGNFQSSSHLGHGTPTNSTSSTYQLPTSEIRTGVSSAMPSSHLVSTVLPRVDRPLVRLDGRPNGSLYPSQVQVNYTANSSVRTPTWSVQPQSGSSAKICSDTKVPVNMSVKVEGVADGKSGLAPQATPRPVITQSTNGTPRVHQTLQGTNSVETPSLGNTHTEISKIIQKLFQSQDSERSHWKPPSRDYMNKALTCQMCTFTITEIDSLLVCDACEKGFHLKCMQTTNQKGVPRGEWHCGRCLSLSNGKPIPPKYGRVMRNINTPKMPSNAAAVTSTSTKNVEASDEKISQKVMVNGNTSIHIVPTGTAGSNYTHQVSGTKGEDAKGMQGNGIISSEAKMDDKSSGTCPNNLMKTSSATCVTPVNLSVEKLFDGKVIEFKSDPPAKSDTVPSLSDSSRAPGDAQDSNLRPPSDEVSSPNQSLENHVLSRDLEESHGKVTSNNNLNQLSDQLVRENPSETTVSTGVTEHYISATDGLHAVYWAGDTMKVVDEKTFYQSCYINGHMYKVQDYVLIRFDNDRLIPSKLQAMWEDSNTRVKWVTVNRCYFPDDLPEAVGRPCGLESSEVCVSNRDSTLMAGLIQSPCEVLPPRKFAEESERRTHLRPKSNDRLPPLYLCKWIYDESKGLFRDISC